MSQNQFNSQERKVPQIFSKNSYWLCLVFIGTFYDWQSVRPFALSSSNWVEGFLSLMLTWMLLLNLHPVDWDFWRKSWNPRACLSWNSRACLNWNSRAHLSWNWRACLLYHLTIGCKCFGRFNTCLRWVSQKLLILKVLRKVT